ncbi:MAG: ATP-binding protein [Candidatus Thorarchaeota archaeon]
MKTASKPDKTDLPFELSVFETIREPLLVLDKNLQIVVANQAFFKNFQVTQEETLHKFIYDIGNRQWDIPRLHKLFNDILPDRTTIENFEVEHIFEKIGKRIMLLNARQIFHGKNILVAIEDITEKKKYETDLINMNENLKKLSNAKTEFVTVVSHELKTPLTSILGFTQTLHKTALSNEQVNRYFEIIESEGKRLIAMLDNLLNIAKIEAGYIDVEYRAVDLSKVVEEILTLYSIPPQINIKKVFHPDAILVKGDKDKIKQVIMNIFNNALNYTMPAGHITISSSQIGPDIVISIENDGPGISKKDQNKIFDMFFRDKTKKGTGLGLAIAKKLVELHEGRIWVESDGIKGSKFYFSLPKQ